MVSKIKLYVVKTFHFVKKNYPFPLAVFFIVLGLDLINSSAWTYNSSDSEIIGIYIRAGLQQIAGAILVGFSLIALILNSKK